jgi:nitrite reductase (NADH) small subunit
VTRHVLCRRDDIAPGAMGVFVFQGRELAVARTRDDRFYALRNRCPHQGAPLGRGFLTGTFLASDVGEFVYGRDSEIVRCPWHRWEFDATTGRSLHDPEGCRVASYAVRVEGDEVLLDMG